MEDRRENIQKLTRNLYARFRERVFDDRKKAEKLRRLHPRFADEYFEKWEQYDKLAEKYIVGKVEWDGSVDVQLEFNDKKEPVPTVNNPETMQKFARDFYCWFMSKTGAL